jgi:oxygen-independent coproporphyrinogen-3 oxidase
MLRGTSVSDLGVYVHVPFCERICPYCDFAVEAAGELDPELASSYVDGLRRELELVLREEGASLSGRPLATIYLGGGTPGLLPGEEVKRLLDLLREHFGSAAEVTLELNPGWLETRRLSELLAAGVTRLSVGVQSLSDGTLRRLGRAQAAVETRRGLEACLAAGFASVSADLIHSVPGQTAEELLADLETVVDLGVDHVSAYALTIEPETPFGRARAAGRMILPDEDTALAMSQAVRARLAASGLSQYEISSYARPGHRSRHNQRYWLRADVLGLGVGAASLVGGRRFLNYRQRPVWERELAQGRLPRLECETIDDREARRETLALGLRRLAGVSRAVYMRHFGASPEADFGPELRELRELGLIADRSGRIALTERGILFSDEVFLRFVGR